MRRTRWAGLPAHGPGRESHLSLGHLAPALAERFDAPTDFDAPIDFGRLLGYRVSLNERGFA